MTKLQFEFTVVASPRDEKSNIIAITSLRTESGKTYVFQEDNRYMANHKELMKTEKYSKVKNSLKKRHQSRKVWISMTKELEEIYIDEDGNIQFADEYLEEIEEKQVTEINTNISDILEKWIETSQKKEGEKNLKHIAEKYMIEKFTSRHSNANQWIETFEKECARFDITQDEMKIEILRLFLDKSCTDWHCATLTKLGITAKWSEWKSRFVDTFADKGWSTVTYALSFKYKEGSLIDYAMRKERLLLDMNKEMDAKTLVALIAIGLPQFIMHKIDKEFCEDNNII